MKLFKRIFPEKPELHGWIALAAIIFMNTIVYYSSRLITASGFHYDFTTPIDLKIPFIPAFILVYSVLGYLQWIIGYYWSSCEDKKTVFFIFGAEILAKVPSMVIFLLIPTTMTRPEITGTDFFSGKLYTLANLTYAKKSSDMVQEADAFCFAACYYIDPLCQAAFDS